MEFHLLIFFLDNSVLGMSAFTKCNLYFFCVNYLEVVAYLTDILLQKVSQFMTRVVRLNEAFSVVRRVPIIRPSLPASGINPWPVMSLR